MSVSLDSGVGDLVLLDVIDEDHILQNLRVRLKAHLIYVRARGLGRQWVPEMGEVGKRESTLTTMCFS